MENDTVPNYFSYTWNDPGTEMYDKYCMILLILEIEK